MSVWVCMSLFDRWIYLFKTCVYVHLFGRWNVCVWSAQVYVTGRHLYEICFSIYVFVGVFGRWNVWVCHFGLCVFWLILCDTFINHNFDFCLFVVFLSSSSF